MKNALRFWQALGLLCFTCVPALAQMPLGWEAVADASGTKIQLNGYPQTMLYDLQGRLVIAGNFSQNNLRFVASWNDTTFQRLDSAAVTLQANSIINGLCMDPSGNLYAGAAYGPNGRWYIARWNGVSWRPLGGDTSLTNAYYTIYSMCTDRSGNLYASSIHTPGTRYYIAQWNGQRWRDIDSLGPGAPKASANVLLQGTDSNSVYAAGNFANAAGKRYVAKWDGTGWTEVGTGTSGLRANGAVYCLTKDRQGNLYAAGDFTDSAGARYVAKWNGNSWQKLGSGTGALNAFGSIRALYCDVDGSVYAGGAFTDAAGHIYVSKWNGSSWAALPMDTSLILSNPRTAPEIIYCLFKAKDGTLYAGGEFRNTATGLFRFARYTTKIIVTPTSVSQAPVSGTDVTVYPNPASNQIYISLQSARAGGELTLTLYDLNGRVIASQKQPITSAVTQSSLDAEVIPSGTYVLQISDGVARGSYKLVIRH